MTEAVENVTHWNQLTITEDGTLGGFYTQHPIGASPYAEGWRFCKPCNEWFPPGRATLNTTGQAFCPNKYCNTRLRCNPRDRKPRRD